MKKRLFALACLILCLCSGCGKTQMSSSELTARQPKIIFGIDGNTEEPEDPINRTGSGAHDLGYPEEISSLLAYRLEQYKDEPDTLFWVKATPGYSSEEDQVLALWKSDPGLKEKNAQFYEEPAWELDDYSTPYRCLFALWDRETILNFVQNPPEQEGFSYDFRLELSHDLADPVSKYMDDRFYCLYAGASDTDLLPINLVLSKLDPEDSLKNVSYQQYLEQVEQIFKTLPESKFSMVSGSSGYCVCYVDSISRYDKDYKIWTGPRRSSAIVGGNVIGIKYTDGSFTYSGNMIDYFPYSADNEKKIFPMSSPHDEVMKNINDLKENHEADHESDGRFRCTLEEFYVDRTEHYSVIWSKAQLKSFLASNPFPEYDLHLYSLYNSSDNEIKAYAKKVCVPEYYEQ